MFLLFLIGLGTAHVNAQVRIGGNAAPNGAAVLDLNATDAATGTKGLALPRVRLDSATMQITPGVANLNGMLVYNTTATLGAIGIYFWNGTTWVRASLPSTSVVDSGCVLRSDGNVANWGVRIVGSLGWDTVHLATPIPVSWTKILDTIITFTARHGYWRRIYAAGLKNNDLCYVNGAGATEYFWDSNLILVTLRDVRTNTVAHRISCWRSN